MSIVVVEYGLGNPGSILNMLRHLGIDAMLSGDPDVILKAHKLILPGVGAFDHGIGLLRASGLHTLLTERVMVDKIPILGICLGMQLMTARSEEGLLPGLGWINAKTARFSQQSVGALRVPHTGWNKLTVTQSHPLTKGLEGDSKFYFVHSYYVACNDIGDRVATTRYGFDFDSIIARENISGCQFHPEKSHRYGMRVLQNFHHL